MSQQRRLEGGEPGILATCRSRIRRGVSLLDPSAEARGPIVTRWNLRINVELGADWTSEFDTDPEPPPRQLAASGAKMQCMTGLDPRMDFFLYAGRTLAEWAPIIVERVAERFDPERIVLFGSLASGRAGPDSDIDLLVIFREQADRRSTAVALRLAVADIPAPIDFVVTDLGEIERRGGIVGSVLGAALRDGKVVYSRA